jgi:hypothetical protein
MIGIVGSWAASGAAGTGGDTGAAGAGATGVCGGGSFFGLHPNTNATAITETQDHLISDLNNNLLLRVFIALYPSIESRETFSSGNQLFHREPRAAAASKSITIDIRPSGQSSKRYRANSINGAAVQANFTFVQMAGCTPIFDFAQNRLLLSASRCCFMPFMDEPRFLDRRLPPQQFPPVLDVSWVWERFSLPFPTPPDRRGCIRRF